MKSRRAPLKALITGLLLSAAISAPAFAAGPTIEDVMAAPDDLALNLAFAKSEANAGELLSAAGALERILLAQPNAHQARLFYAAVLYRLGDYQGARQQLRQLDTVELTPLQRAEKERYERSIAKRLNRFEWTGQLAAGLMYEEDALGALATNLDYLTPLPQEEGTSQVYSGRLDVQYKLRPEGEFAIYGSVAGYHKEEIDGPESEFQRGELRLGLKHVGRMAGWQAGIVARKLRLFEEDYLTELGAEASLNKRLNTATTLHLNGEAVSQEYDNEPAYLTFFGGGRDGPRTEVNLGATHRFSSRSILSASAGYEWKEAQREPWSYEAPSFRLGYDQLLGRGAYASVSGQVRNVKYQEEDIFLFDYNTFLPSRREDWRTYARAALGAPLSAFAQHGATGDIREDIKIEGSVNYTSRESNPPLTDWAGWGAELRLIWRFGR